MLEAKGVANGPKSPLFTAAKSPNATRAERWLQEQLKRARREGAFTITVELTPELAELLLANNPQNRKLSPHKVAEYARDITAGNWRHNGETVIIADTGELNDGQHRCQAVVETGRSITTEMTFGVERDSRKTVDIGMKRAIGQHLQMAGHANGKMLGHAVAVILTFQKIGRISAGPEARPTGTEIMAWAAAHEEMQEHLIKGGRVARKFKASGGLFAALHYLFSQKSPIDTERFFTALENGSDLGKNDPVYRLREALLADLRAKAKLPDAEIAARVIKAWNHFRRGQSIKYLRRISEGRASEQYPVPE